MFLSLKLASIAAAAAAAAVAARQCLDRSSNYRYLLGNCLSLITWHSEFAASTRFHINKHLRPLNVRNPHLAEFLTLDCGDALA